MASGLKWVGFGVIAAGIVWLLLGIQVGLVMGAPSGIGFSLMTSGLAGGPILIIAGGLLAAAISQRRQTGGEWIGWAFIFGGLAWSFPTFVFAPLYWSLEATAFGRVLALVLIAAGIGVLAWENRPLQRADMA